MATVGQLLETPDETRPLNPSAADERDARTETTDRWWKRSGGALPIAFLSAWVSGLGSGYIMNVNTTYIGRDMNDMKQGALIVILPSIPSALVPSFVPFLRRRMSRKDSTMVGAVIAATGFFFSFLAGSHCRLVLLKLAQCILAVGSGLLNLLMLLAIREATMDSQSFAICRAVYMAVMNLGMVAGALGGIAMMEYNPLTGFFEDSRTWQTPFLVQFAFAVVLIGSVFWFALDTPKNDRIQEDEIASTNPGVELVGTMLISCVTITPIALFSALLEWGINALYFAIALPLECVFAICLVTWLRGPQDIYSAEVLHRLQIYLLVFARAAVSVVVSTLLYRLPLHAQISIMTESGPPKQGSHPLLDPGHQPCKGTVPVGDFKQNVMLPTYYAGQLIGEFVATAGIRAPGRESIPLVISLVVYFVAGQLLGNGAIGHFSGASRGERLALGPMFITLLGGIANGSADNCLSTFLFAVVDQCGEWLPRIIKLLISDSTSTQTDRL
jgi:hypothetical protein